MNDSRLLQFKFNGGAVYFRFFLWTVLLILILISFVLGYERNGNPWVIIMLSIYIMVQWITNFRFLIAVIKQIPAFEIKEGSLYDYQSGVVVDWAEVKSYGLVKSYLSYYIEFKVKNKKKLSLIKNPVMRMRNLISLSKELVVFSINVSLLENDGIYLFSAIEKFEINMSK